MDLRAITKVLLKLVGLYYLTMVITAIPSVLVATKQEMVVQFAYISIGVWGVVGLALLMFPGIIIDRVIRIQGLEPEAVAGRECLLGAGVRLLGCFFAISTLYGLVYHWSINHIFNGSITPDMRPDEQAAFLASVVQLVAGLLLWIFGNPVIRFLDKKG